MGSRMPDIAEDGAREGGRGSQRGRGTNYGRDGDYGHDSTRGSHGRGRTRGRHERDATEQGGLSAVTGLGLTGLDEFGGPRGLDEVSREK